MVVDSNPGPGYGTIRALHLRRALGHRGNMITLPVGGGLLYIEPV